MSDEQPNPLKVLADTMRPQTPEPAPARVLSLAERRSPQTEATWDPLTALKVFMHEMESKPDVKIGSIAIHWTEIQPGEREQPKVWYANMSFEMAIAMCELMKRRAIEEWIAP